MKRTTLAILVSIAVTAGAYAGGIPEVPPIDIPDIPETVSDEEADDLYERYSVEHSDKALSFLFSQGGSEMGYTEKDLVELVAVSSPDAQSLVDAGVRGNRTVLILSLAGLATYVPVMAANIVSIVNGGYGIGWAPYAAAVGVNLGVLVVEIIIGTRATRNLQAGAEAYNIDLADQLGL